MIVQNRHPLLAYILNFCREKANETVAIDFFAELGYCNNVILILIANDKECLFALVDSEWELVKAHDNEVIIDAFEAGQLSPSVFRRYQ